MENRRILNWRSWSPIRKGLAVGGLAGVLVSACLFLVSMIAPEKEFGFFLTMIHLGFSALTILLLRTLGVEAIGSGRSISPLAVFLLSVVVNSVLLVLLGGVIGYVVHLFRKQTSKKQ